MLQLTERQKENFFNKVSVTDSCWLWTGYKDKSGYGRVGLNHKELWMSHRLSYAIHNGDIGNLLVLHSCDNPSCVNPDHLFLGTQKDNMIDAKNKGRKWSGETSGEKNPNSKITKELALYIKSLLSQKKTRKEISKMVNQPQTLINNIAQGRSWVNV